MVSTAFFTTEDGDIILRAGTEPGPKHDFRVHKLILSLASSVFRDMFTFPQPLDQTLDEQHGLPVADISEAPEVFDIVLRSIYPGVTPPKVTEQATLTALLFTGDKYDISLTHPVFGESLKTFLLSPSDSFWVYIMACRFGFPDVAKEAVQRLSKDNLLHLGNREHRRYLSSTNLCRLAQFVKMRYFDGRDIIRHELDPSILENSNALMIERRL